MAGSWLSGNEGIFGRRGPRLVTALAACGLVTRLAGQTPAPARIAAGAGLTSATPLADLSLTSTRQPPEGLCLRGRLCAIDVTARNNSDIASPAVTVATVDGRSESDFDRMGVSVAAHASQTLRVYVFVPADHPAVTLERTFELRFPTGRPYSGHSPEGNRITAKIPIDVVEAQIFGVGGLPRGPVRAGTAIPLTVRLKNEGTVRIAMRFREEGLGRGAESPNILLEPDEVKPVPWMLVVPQRAPARFTTALVISWVDTPSRGILPRDARSFSSLDSPHGNRFDLAIDVVPLPAFDLQVLDALLGAPVLKALRHGEPPRITGLELTTVLKNRGTETWGSSLMIGVLLSMGRPETTLQEIWRMDYAVAGPIAPGANRGYPTPLLGRAAAPERGLSPGQWYTLDLSVVSSDDRHAANNRRRFVFLLDGSGRVSEIHRLP